MVKLTRYNRLHVYAQDLANSLELLGKLYDKVEVEELPHFFKIVVYSGNEHKTFCLVNNITGELYKTVDGTNTVGGHLGNILDRIRYFNKYGILI